MITYREGIYNHSKCDDCKWEGDGCSCCPISEELSLRLRESNK